MSDDHKPRRWRDHPASYQRWRDSEEELHRLDALLREIADADDGPHRATLRQRVIVGHLPLAHRLAAKYHGRGVPVDDLAQVAAIGLVKAVDGFRPEVGLGFLGYAIPTIQGEIRRYFRDSTWSMRVPRALKERHLAITRATATLSASAGRAPRPSELAAHLRLSVDEVLEGLAAGECYNATSLDQYLANDRNGGFSLGEDDARLELIENRHAMRPLLDGLPDRERTILMMRFVEELTQSQIAEQIGVCQVHVSRLLGRTLEGLRQQQQRADQAALI